MIVSAIHHLSQIESLQRQRLALSREAQQIFRRADNGIKPIHLPETRRAAHQPNIVTARIDLARYPCHLVFRDAVSVWRNIFGHLHHSHCTTPRVFAPASGRGKILQWVPAAPQAESASRCSNGCEVLEKQLLLVPIWERLKVSSTAPIDPAHATTEQEERI